MTNEQSENIMHAEIRWPGGGGIMLGDRLSDDEKQPELPEGPSSVYIATGEPDALFERAVQADAEIIRGLTEEGYGSRGPTAIVPEGNMWSFRTYASE
ncbi:MAG: hypothetical protein QF637_11100 [Acidimicrobiales bacterium]|nr:hypothetical protein [Acidimicrobiales bacterium]